MSQFHIQPWAKVGTLKNATVLDLTAELSQMKIENDLRREVQDNIRRLRDMGTYKGRRHAMGLPVRGQRTRTQVRRAYVYKFYVALTAADYKCSQAKQDRKRWLWKGERIDGGCSSVEKSGFGHCKILYYMRQRLDRLKCVVLCGTCGKIKWLSSC
jgi:ribosomal protein S13